MLIVTWVDGVNQVFVLSSGQDQSGPGVRFARAQGIPRDPKGFAKAVRDHMGFIVKIDDL